MSQRRRNIRTQTEQELAELEAEEQKGQEAEGSHTQDRRQTGAVVPQVLPAPSQQEEPEESRSHLVKHRAPRAETEEEQFDSVYKRDTYYIDRAYIKRLKKLIHDSQHTKTYLMNEALDLLFKKYGSE